MAAGYVSALRRCDDHGCHEAARALEKGGNEGEKCLIGKYTLTMGQFTRMVCEISGAPLLRRRLPGPLAMAGATLATKVADLSRRPPFSAMSTDTVRNAREEAVFDGGRAYPQINVFLKRSRGDSNPWPPPCKGGATLCWSFLEFIKYLQTSAFLL